MKHRRSQSNSKKTNISHKGRNQMNVWHQYSHERDQFFAKHKNSRVLIGALIVAFSVYLGGLIHKTSENYISQVLTAEGIPYPYEESMILGVTTQK